MTFGAEGLRREQNMRRMEGAGPETHSLMSCLWWSLALRLYQGGLAFNALVRSKCRYGLPFL